ncbi:hypothetical protein ACSSS7_000250 [Eimeria intestinalis]
MQGFESADASSASWYTHKRHAFIITYSGKPVYSRSSSISNDRSSCSAAAAAAADGSSRCSRGTLSAIISKLERFRGDKPPDVLRVYALDSIVCGLSEVTFVVAAVDLCF